MVDFNSDIPKGKPELDPTYWNKFKDNEESQNSPLSNFNTNRALEEISIFNGVKKIKFYIPQFLRVKF